MDEKAQQEIREQEIAEDVNAADLAMEPVTNALRKAVGGAVLADWGVGSTLELLRDAEALADRIVDWGENFAAQDRGIHPPEA